MVYGIGFGYLGITVRVFNSMRLETTAGLTYLIVSGLLVIGFMILLARRLGQDA